MSTAPITKEENTASIKDIAGIIETLNRESMAMIKEGILKKLGETQLYEDPTGTLCFLQKDVGRAIEKGYNDQVAKLDEIIKDMTGAENILVFVENTNRESMMMIKNGILNAIEALKDNDKLYKDSTDPSKLYFLQTDINIAIEEGYTIQVAAYEELRKYTIAGTTKSNTKEIDRIVDKAKTTPLPSNASLNNAPLNIATLHTMVDDGVGKVGKIVDEEMGDVMAELDIDSHKYGSLSLAPNGRIWKYSANMKDRTLFGTIDKSGNTPWNGKTVKRNSNGEIVTIGGKYRPKKNKKSRKHPK